MRRQGKAYIQGKACKSTGVHTSAHPPAQPRLAGPQLRLCPQHRATAPLAACLPAVAQPFVLVAVPALRSAVVPAGAAAPRASYQPLPAS